MGSLSRRRWSLNFSDIAARIERDQSEALDETFSDDSDEDDVFHDCELPTRPLAVDEAKHVEAVRKEPQRLEPVVLNVYNLMDSDESVVTRMSTTLGFGLYHCGVQVHGREWAFAGTIFEEDRSETGVFWTLPRTAIPNFTEPIHVGWTALDKGEVRRVLRDLKRDWTRGVYHILHRNCNHFAEAFAKVLVNERTTIPPWINRVAWIGDLLLPEMVLNYFVDRAHAQMRAEVAEQKRRLGIEDDNAAAEQSPPECRDAIGIPYCVSPSPLTH